MAVKDTVEGSMDFSVDHLHLSLMCFAKKAMDKGR